MTARHDASLTHGFVVPGCETVVEEFERNLSERGDTGAAFAAFKDGKPVIDLWGGLADRGQARPWLRDTIVGIFSGTKGFIATCLLQLIERGALDLERPVSDYWPEFATGGKESILVRHLVSHQAGLPGLTTPIAIKEVGDHRRLAALLANQAAICAPGSRLYYHAITFGWLCGEIIRRIDGRSAGRFFEQEIARPLALDAWIGLPARCESRVAVLQAGPEFAAQDRNHSMAMGHDRIAWSIWANPPRFSTDPLPANTRQWHASEIPASNGIASARSVARLYGCLARGGEIDGVRLLDPSSLDLATTCLARGFEPYLEEPLAFGVGFELQTEATPFGPAAVAYGHTGAGGSVHGAWPELRTGFSYVTNTLRESRRPDSRSDALLAALYEVLTAGNRAREPSSAGGIRIETDHRKRGVKP